MKPIALPSKRTRLLSLAVIFALAVGPGCQDQSSLSPSPKSPEAEAVAAAAKYVQTNELPGEDLPIAWTGDPSKPFNSTVAEPKEFKSTVQEAGQKLKKTTGRKARFISCTGEKPDVLCDIRGDNQSILSLASAEVKKKNAEIAFVRLIEAGEEGEDFDVDGLPGLYVEGYTVSLEKDGADWKVTEISYWKA